MLRPLSTTARSLPEILTNLAQYGQGATAETVLLSRAHLERLASAAKELRDIVENAI